MTKMSVGLPVMQDSEMTLLFLGNWQGKMTASFSTNANNHNKQEATRLCPNPRRYVPSSQPFFQVAQLDWGFVSSGGLVIPHFWTFVSFLALSFSHPPFLSFQPHVEPSFGSRPVPVGRDHGIVVRQCVGEQANVANSPTRSRNAFLHGPSRRYHYH